MYFIILLELVLGVFYVKCFEFRNMVLQWVKVPGRPFWNRKLYRLSVPAHEHDGLVSLQCLCLCLLVLVSLFHQDHLDALLHCVLLGFLDSAGFVRCQFGKGRPKEGPGVSPAEKKNPGAVTLATLCCLLFFGITKIFHLPVGKVKSKDPVLFLRLVRLIDRFKKF